MENSNHTHLYICNLIEDEEQYYILFTPQNDPKAELTELDSDSDNHIKINTEEINTDFSNCEDNDDYFFQFDESIKDYLLNKYKTVTNICIQEREDFGFFSQIT